MSNWLARHAGISLCQRMSTVAASPSVQSEWTSGHCYALLYLHPAWSTYAWGARSVHGALGVCMGC